MLKSIRGLSQEFSYPGFYTFRIQEVIRAFRHKSYVNFVYSCECLIHRRQEPMNEIFFNMAKMRLFSVCSKAEQQMSREKYDFTARMNQLKLQAPGFCSLRKTPHTGQGTSVFTAKKIQETSPVLKDAQAFFRISSERKNDTRISQCLICWSSW